jgi:hypothetical protein
MYLHIRIGIANEAVVKGTPGHILKVLDQATPGDSNDSKSILLLDRVAMLTVHCESFGKG